MTLTIGQAAKSTGVAARTIRFYEAVGVLPAAIRTAAGYRQYTDNSLQQLLFIPRARALGLSLRQLRALMAALDGESRGPVRPRVREVVRAHLATVQRQISELRMLRAAARAGAAPDPGAVATPSGWPMPLPRA
jgi:MerR family transcriptional regulator, copper efflux regulator